MHNVAIKHLLAIGLLHARLQLALAVVAHLIADGTLQNPGEPKKRENKKKEKKTKKKRIITSSSLRRASS